jgi:hypothetical protein
VTRTVAIVLALSAQKKAVEPLILAHRPEAFAAASQQFVHIALMADIKNELVFRCIEDAVQRQRQFDHAEIRPEMSADRGRVFFGKNADQFIADFLRELRQILFRDGFDIGGRLDG